MHFRASRPFTHSDYPDIRGGTPLISYKVIRFNIQRCLTNIITVMTQIDNKRIAKNTLYMYLRMLVTMVVSLFTSRIIFRALGVDNFGIYNVVGSVIVFFSFLNNGLTTATRRYITAEIAQGDEESQQNVFNLAVWAHVLIAAIILVLGETAGLWAVNNVLNLPEDRMLASNVVYQLSILSAILQVMQSPFTAAITSHERMSIYAYLSILDVTLRLGLAYVVMISPYDKLIVYAVSIFLVGGLNILFNRIYCYKKFPMCRYKRPHNKSLLKEMFGYMGWSLGGQLMVVFTNQGVTVLVNMFFTVAANAAMGVSNQITHIVSNFVTNFQIAFNPQITKQYVSKNWDEMNRLAIRSSRYSCFLVLLFLIPICCQISNFLGIWLGDYPQYAVEFCILTLVGIYLDAVSAPMWMILSSDKDVKKYQIVISSIYAFNFIGAWIMLKFGLPPYSVIIARITVYLVAIIARILLVKERVPSFSIRQWTFPLLLNTLVLSLIPLLCYIGIDKLPIHLPIVELFVKGGLVFLITAMSIFLIGFNKNERRFIIGKVPIIKTYIRYE